MVIRQYEVYLISLDPTIGHEIKKARPCVIISPDEMNKSISTVIIAPLTTQSRFYPTRIPLKFAEKEAWIVLDQLRTVDRKRLIKKLGETDQKTINQVKSIIKEMLVD
ncbi:type II toxin-antitoxin system PemK/MazF family toxin [Candidatus Atribacteria bacterium 1244-E10-H5-B2]|nr:MAG: type II toxin-antitoxin system PemK/MazF family toxin [Candidatus Atribacteria bacterium 1244-E10-H5-B2]